MRLYAPARPARMRLTSNAGRLRGALKLLARSRGHGVHSPLAYSLVCDLLHPDCPYYNQAEAMSIARREGCNRRLALMVFRLACRIDCRRASVAGGDSRALRQILRLTRSEIDTSASQPQMAVVTSGADIGEAMRIGRSVAASGGYMIISGLRGENRAVWNGLLEGLDHGISLEGADIALLAAASHLPRQHYDVWI